MHSEQRRFFQAVRRSNKFAVLSCGSRQKIGLAYLLRNDGKRRNCPWIHLHSGATWTRVPSAIESVFLARLIERNETEPTRQRGCLSAFQFSSTSQFSPLPGGFAPSGIQTVFHWDKDWILGLIRKRKSQRPEMIWSSKGSGATRYLKKIRKIRKN